MVRGSPTEFFGATDLLLRDEDGKPKGILQADQTVYLHPLQAKLPEEAMVVGETDFPDVVLEVDYVTDVRRGKLSLYESWGFPEVWVEVPDQRELGQLCDPLPGMTIHVLEGGAYRQVPESRALLGWTAEEIHVAFNEETRSEETYQVLERVGMTLGAREGTGPDDDPLMRSLRHRDTAGMVRAMLLSRDIDVSGHFSQACPPLGKFSVQTIVAAALACTSEADFMNRLRAAPKTALTDDGEPLQSRSFPP